MRAVHLWHVRKNQNEREGMGGTVVLALLKHLSQGRDLNSFMSNSTQGVDSENGALNRSMVFRSMK